MTDKHGSMQSNTADDESLVAARREAERSPRDGALRALYGRALLDLGFRASAWHEFLVAERLGVAIPATTRAEFCVRTTAGTVWTFAPFVPDEQVAAPVADPRYPGARVRCANKELPLVLALGAACTECDENGMVPDPEFGPVPMLPPAAIPLEVCSMCEGTKFVVERSVGREGTCRHPAITPEMQGNVWSLSRCSVCGLAAITCGSFDAFACGVCGLFACSCRAQKAISTRAATTPDSPEPSTSVTNTAPVANWSAIGREIGQLADPKDRLDLMADELAVLFERHARFLAANAGMQSVKWERTLIAGDLEVQNLLHSLPGDDDQLRIDRRSMHDVALTRRDLSIANLSAMRLSKCRFERCRIVDSMAVKMEATATAWHDVSFHRTDFSDGRFATNRFTACSFERSDLQNTRFVDCVFDRVALALARFENTNFERCEFRDCGDVDDKLRGCHFVACRFDRGSVTSPRFGASNDAVDSFLTEHTLGGMNAAALLGMVTQCADLPDDEARESALAYARARCEELAAKWSFGTTAADIFRTPAGERILEDIDRSGWRVGELIGAGGYGGVFDAFAPDAPPCVLKIAGIEFLFLVSERPTELWQSHGPHVVRRLGATGPAFMRGVRSAEVAQKLLVEARRSQAVRGKSLQRRLDETMYAVHPLRRPWPSRLPPLPALVETLDLGGRAAAVYERLRGNSVRQLMGRDRRTAFLALPAIASALYTLHHTHGSHGDVKPDHVFVDGEDVCFVDPLSRDSRSFGTVGYSVPFGWHRKVADVLALAATAAEIAGGTVGWNAQTSSRIADRHTRFGRGPSLGSELSAALLSGTEPVPAPLRTWIRATIAVAIEVIVASDVSENPVFPDREWADERLAALVATPCTGL